MNRLLTILLATTVGTGAFAETEIASTTISGEVEVTIKENAAGDWGSTTVLDLGIAREGTAFGGFNFASTDGGDLTLDEWQLGTSIGTAATVSLGKQGDIWVGAEGEHTIANPKMDESVIVDLGSVAVAVELGDYKNDVTDIEAVAGAMHWGEEALGGTVALDYDLDAENWTFGSRVDVDNFGGVVTYAESTEKLAFEIDATTNGITAYINGDEDELARNIGAGYEMDFNGMTVEPKANYDLDAEEFSPSIVASFNF